jgi:cold shock protein
MRAYYKPLASKQYCRCDLMKGKVKMFNAARGFGFITGDDGKDVYVHTSAIEGGAALAVGDSVEYEVESGERGPRAKNVKKL